MTVHVEIELGRIYSNRPTAKGSAPEPPPSGSLLERLVPGSALSGVNGECIIVKRAGCANDASATAAGSGR